MNSVRSAIDCLLSRSDDMKSRTNEINENLAPTSQLWLRLILTYLFIALVLMLCGGDFGWWQAWVYAVLLLAAGIGGRIWAENRHPGILVERATSETATNVKSWDKVLAPLMAVSITFPLVIVAGLDHHFRWSPVFPTWFSILGFISSFFSRSSKSMTYLPSLINNGL